MTSTCRLAPALTLALALLALAGAAPAAAQDGAADPDSRPAFALSTSQVFTTREAPHVYLTFRRKPSPHDRPVEPKPVLTSIAAFIIGAYDGFIGPGTGTFLIIAFVALMGDSMARASANAKVVNFASNLAALAAFGWKGKVVWAGEPAELKSSSLAKLVPVWKNHAASMPCVPADSISRRCASTAWPASGGDHGIAMIFTAWSRSSGSSSMNVSGSGISGAM